RGAGQPQRTLRPPAIRERFLQVCRAFFVANACQRGRAAGRVAVRRSCEATVAGEEGERSWVDPVPWEGAPPEGGPEPPSPFWSPRPRPPRGSRRWPRG